MIVKQYHGKYITDIKARKPLTLEELLNQIKADYSVFDKVDIENGRVAWNRNSFVRDMANKLIKNRTEEESFPVRLSKESYYRNRILFGLFPNANLRLIKKWDEENKQDTFKMPEYRKWMDKVKTGEIYETDKKKKQSVEDDPFFKVFKGHAKEV